MNCLEKFLVDLAGDPGFVGLATSLKDNYKVVTRMLSSGELRVTVNSPLERGVVEEVFTTSEVLEALDRADNGWKPPEVEVEESEVIVQGNVVESLLLTTGLSHSEWMRVKGFDSKNRAHRGSTKQEYQLDLDAFRDKYGDRMRIGEKKRWYLRD